MRSEHSWQKCVTDEVTHLFFPSRPTALNLSVPLYPADKLYPHARQQLIHLRFNYVVSAAAGEKQLCDLSRVNLHDLAFPPLPDTMNPITQGGAGGSHSHPSLFAHPLILTVLQQSVRRQLE